MRSRVIRYVAALCLGFFASLPGLYAANADDRILVFAAASMRDCLLAAADEYSSMGGGEVVISFAASSSLAKQIAAGAPADLYISADRKWADWLITRGHGDAASMTVIAGNRLIVAKAAGKTADTARDTLGDGRFAMGDPSHVPAGRYARQALDSSGTWESVEAHAVFGENVRIALEYVRKGVVESAIVYASDLAVADELEAAFTFPDGSHDEIVYPALIPAGSSGGGKGFLEFLTGPRGQAIVSRYGFRQADG